jgi:hypothetical protein
MNEVPPSDEASATCAGAGACVPPQDAAESQGKSAPALNTPPMAAAILA